MTCSTVKLPGTGLTAILCHRGAPIHNCQVGDCDEFASNQCDWKVPGGTCDLYLCQGDSTAVGKNKHLCPDHAEAWRKHPANSQRELDL